MRIFVCGDIHGKNDILKLSTGNWPEQRELSKEDLVINAGDFGLLWAPDWTGEELYWARWLTAKRFTTCFVDGNHENFDRLSKLPEVNFYYGKAGVAFENENGRILHLKRGEIYQFWDKKVFVFGGGLSIDKERRIVGISWWPEEIPNFVECDHALSNLEKHNYEVDYIITHTAPSSIKNDLCPAYLADKFNDPTTKFLEEVNKRTRFRQWHFGHFHLSRQIKDKYICHYNWDPIELF